MIRYIFVPHPVFSRPDPENKWDRILHTGIKYTGGAKGNILFYPHFLPRIINL